MPKRRTTYSFLVISIAYLLAAAVLTLFFIAQTGWGRIDNDILISLISGLTLGLSEFFWWGNVWYLAIIVPWLTSFLLLTFLLSRYNCKARRRSIFSGLAVSAYYLAMCVVLIGQAVFRSGGDTGYFILSIWVAGGIALGYVSAVVVEKIIVNN
jgi:hypothetical protein